MSDQIEWCIDHNVGKEDCPDCKAFNTQECPVVIYRGTERVIVGHATLENNPEGIIATFSLGDNMPSFVEAFTEGLVSGFTITPERNSLEETYRRLMENERRKILEDGTTLPYNKKEAE